MQIFRCGFLLLKNGHGSLASARLSLLYSDYLIHKKDSEPLEENLPSEKEVKNAQVSGKYRAPREKTKLSYKEQKEEVDAEIDLKMDRYVELQEMVDSFFK